MKKFGTVILKELREALPITFFFLFLFHMIYATKMVVLDDFSGGVLRAATATIAALLVAKSILIVEALPVSRLVADRGWLNILWKTALFGLMVLLFEFLEEMIHLMREYGDFSVALAAMFNEILWPFFVIVSLWVLSGLVLYCVVSELARAMEPGKARNVILHGNRTTGASH
jgi:hypothetical protein